jgi:hypothetical protein
MRVGPSWAGPGLFELRSERAGRCLLLIRSVNGRWVAWRTGRVSCGFLPRVDVPARTALRGRVR